MLTYTIWSLPFQEPLINVQEIVNEFFVWLSAYWMLLFTDWIPDDKKVKHTNINLKNELGKLMLGLIGVFILCNMFVVGYAAVC